MNKLLPLSLTIILTIILSKSSLAQNEEWLTYYEKSGYKETPKLDETIEFCKKLDAASDLVTYTTFGKSPQGRDLPLLILDKEGRKSAREVKQTERLVILIQAGIHAGEIDGKDAGLMLFRDIAIEKKYPGLLSNATIIFIPVFNVDGHERFGPYNRINQNGPEEMGWRTTANNLNLNRDFLKADAPEMKAWLKMYVEWMPDFFIDIHTTDGADYQYSLTYNMAIYGNLTPALTEWQNNIFLPYVDAKMTKAGHSIFPYVIFRKWHDPRSGLISYVANPMLSDGYSSVQNRPGILIETHMLKDYKTRVTATYDMVINCLTILNKEAFKYKRMIEDADNFVSGSEFRKNYVLKYEASKDTTMIDFKGFEYQAIKSDLSGGDWFKYSKTPNTFKIAYFNVHRPAVSVVLPEAYIIPAEWKEVISRLELHGVEIRKLTKATKIQVNTYIFKDLEFRSTPYEGRQTVSKFDYTEQTFTKEFPAGSVVIDMNQPTAALVAHVLEPKAPGSFVYWGFFNSIFEQKEYFESYVMEKMARDMLQKDADLKKEFEDKIAKDKDFAANPDLILRWFYLKTPYFDTQLNIYPVGRIMNSETIESLPLQE